MYRRKIVVTAAAAFSIGAAFAAQPISDPAEPGAADIEQQDLWVPGRNMLMSGDESSVAPVAPPR